MEESRGAASDPRSRGYALREPLLFAAVLLPVFAFTSGLAGPVALDTDVANLALAIDRFDVLQHQPHPPGYLGYVLVLKAARLVSGLPGLDIARLVSRFFALAAILMTALAARRLAGGDRSAARFALLLAATHPIILYYAVDGQTHSAEAAMSAALVWAVAERPRSAWGVVACGLLVAAGGSFRVTYVVLCGPVLLLVLWRDWRRLAAVAAIGLAGTMAWLIPTALMSGGWARYWAANDALIGTFIRQASPLSSAGDPGVQVAQVRSTVVWLFLAVAPALASLLLLLPLRGARLSERERRALSIFLVMAIPSGIFYLLVPCAEPGYLAGLVPPAVAVAALLARPNGQGLGWRRLVPAVVAAGQLTLFVAGPQHLEPPVMLPGVAEIGVREAFQLGHHRALVGDARPGDRVLVVTDFPELSSLRQLPLLRPATDVLFVHRPKWFPATGGIWISLATRDGWTGAPGRVVANPGHDDHGLTTSRLYDRIVVDPLATPALRRELQAQTTCRIIEVAGERKEAEAQSLLPTCFADHTLRFGDRFFRFAALPSRREPGAP